MMFVSCLSCSPSERLHPGRRKDAHPIITQEFYLLFDHAQLTQLKDHEREVYCKLWFFHVSPIQYIFPKNLKANHWLSKTNKSNLFDFPSGHGKFPELLHQFIQEVANTVILLMEEILHQLICFSSTNPFKYVLWIVSDAGCIRAFLIVAIAISTSKTDDPPHPTRKGRQH